MLPFLHFFGKSIPTYGLLVLLGAFAAWLLICLLAKTGDRVNRSDASLTYLIAVAGGFVGAVVLRPIMKTIEVAVFWEKYKIISAENLLHYIVGEIVFYGGLLGGLFAVFLFCRSFKISAFSMLDLFVPAIALGHAIGRIGCLCAGCCYGISVPVGHPFAIVYPPASLEAPPGVPLLAVPLIESVFLFVLAAVLSVLYAKVNMQGLCLSVYFLLYPVERFILEFYRGDLVRGTYGPFTTSQYISAALFAFGVCLLALTLRKRGNKNALTKEETTAVLQ